LKQPLTGERKSVIRLRVFTSFLWVVIGLIVFLPIGNPAQGQQTGELAVIKEEGYEYRPAESLNGTFASIKFRLLRLHATTVTDQVSDLKPVRRLLGGDDDVYAIVQWKDSFGKGMMVAPLYGRKGDADDGKAWKMKTGKTKEINLEFSALNIKPGEEAILQVTFIESDGTPLGDIFSLAGNAASLYFLNTPLPKEVDNLVKKLKDGDDWLGTFRWRIVNDGALNGRAGGYQLVKGTHFIKQTLSEQQFEMRGSGAVYQGTIVNDATTLIK